MSYSSEIDSSDSISKCQHSVHIKSLCPYLSLFPNLCKHQRKCDQVNVSILDEYREILSNCGCNICTVGEKVEPDRFGRLEANNYCCRVNDKMAALSTKYNSFSSRTLERFFNLARNVNKSCDTFHKL